MNTRFLSLSLCGAAILALGSCSKKINKFQSDYFTTEPTPLETVGADVKANVTGHIPAKFIIKNAKVTITPVLQWINGNTISELPSAPTVIQGEDVRANGIVVPYTYGGSVNIPVSVPYSTEMAKSDLYLDFQVDQNGKIYALPRVKVGNGVVATSTLASAETVMPAIARDKFQRIINETYSADIHFLINQSNIRSSETSKADYINLNKRLAEANAAPNREIAGVNVNSYASPDGKLAYNTSLAEKREQNTTKFMEEQLKKDKIAEFGELTSSFTPEDWEGFKELVEKSDIQDKDLIISVLSMYKDPEQREQEIRNLSSVFNELADRILPQLRYSRIKASINVIGKSDDELINLFNTTPEKLSADEILYLATLTDDNIKKMEIYNKACEIYPQDYRAFNNLGLTQYIDRDYDAATANFSHAARLAPEAKEVEMNQGLLSMMNNDYNRAAEQLGAAAGVPEVSDALGVYYLHNGDLSKALGAFGDNKTNNAALAQILAKDYSSASKTLSSIAQPDATTYYLTAILGARTNNENMVNTNLRQAFQLDSSLRERAARDIEFSQFNISYL